MNNSETTIISVPEPEQDTSFNEKRLTAVRCMTYLFRSRKRFYFLLSFAFIALFAVGCTLGAVLGESRLHSITYTFIRITDFDDAFLAALLRTTPFLLAIIALFAMSYTRFGKAFSILFNAITGITSGYLSSPFFGGTVVERLPNALFFALICLFFTLYSAECCCFCENIAFPSDKKGNSICFILISLVALVLCVGIAALGAVLL